MTDPEREEMVIEALVNALSQSDKYPGLMQRRIPRQLRHFDIENTVEVTFNAALNQNMVEIGHTRSSWFTCQNWRLVYDARLRYSLRQNCHLGRTC